jgi:CBS domain-containing protein
VTASESQLFTADDLMSRDVKTLDAQLSIREAALLLAQWGIHGAPVVDADGRCVGVFSVSDLARATASRGGSLAQATGCCPFQETYREPGGRETVLCQLPEGACLFQRALTLSDGKSAVACNEPTCVPTDWQMLSEESHPADTVARWMTTAVVTVGADAPVPELARTMLDHGVHRLIVLDAHQRPVGVVSVNDLLQFLAHPELTTPGVSR